MKAAIGTKTVTVMLCIVRICKKCERRNGRLSKLNHRDTDNTALIEIPLSGMPGCTPKAMGAMRRERKDMIFTLCENGLWICPSCKKTPRNELPIGIN